MVIDTSVLVAILLAEDDRRAYLEKMAGASRLLLWLQHFWRPALF
jgi:uncharacterized protein with PIN domain